MKELLPINNYAERKMENLKNKLKEYWPQCGQIPAGAWVLLLSYSLVAFGSPMPPRITWLEIVMGSGLLIGGVMLAGSVIRQTREDAVSRWVVILALALLIVPTCVGLLHGNAWNNMVRDILPFIFLLAPTILLVYSSTAITRPLYSRVLTAALVVVGIVTALTFFVGVYNLVGSAEAMVSMIRLGFAQLAVGQGASQVAEQVAEQVAFNEKAGGMFLKLYDPAMLFAAIFLSAWGVVWIVKSWTTSVPGMLLLILGTVMAYGFMMLGLRAYTAFFVLALGIVSATRWRDVGIYLRLLPMLVIFLFMAWPQIDSIFQLLWAKQQLVGTNGKTEEWQAVLAVVFKSLQTATLGIGWGGVLENPILLGVSSRFTHSALSFYLLKSGVIGLGMLLAAVGLLLYQSRKIGEAAPLDMSRLILLASCLPPLLIGVFFEPSYKMLSYGAILALLVLLLSLQVKQKNDKAGRGGVSVESSASISMKVAS